MLFGRRDMVSVHGFGPLRGTYLFWEGGPESPRLTPPGRSLPSGILLSFYPTYKEAFQVHQFPCLVGNLQ
jgi:hypothetical protein